MKIQTLIFLSFFTSFQIFSLELDLKDLLLSTDEKDTVIYQFYENKHYFITQNRKSNINLFFKFTQDKIFSIELDKDSIFSMYYDEKIKELFFLTMFGEFKIKCYNSFINSKIIFKNTTITNYVADFDIISLPAENIFININAGKIKIEQNQKGIIAIGGDSIAIVENKKKPLETEDFVIGKNYIYNNLYANMRRYSENYQKSSRVKNDENLIGYSKLLSLKNKISLIDELKLFGYPFLY